MNEITRMKSVEPVLYGVLKIAWLDGYQGVVDLRSLLADGEMFEALRKTSERFNEVKLEYYGHKVFWIDDDGDEIDLGSDSLRRRAERQAEILRLAS